MDIKILRTVRKTSSNQLYVSLPLEFTEVKKIKEGDIVYITVEKSDEK